MFRVSPVLSKIAEKFIFVGTKTELGILFEGRDVSIGEKATIILVPEDATFEQRLEMVKNIPTNR